MSVESTLQWAPPFSIALVTAAVVGIAATALLLRKTAGRPIAPARRRSLLVLRLLTLAVLGLILLNPIRVDETAGPIERPKVVYLLDSSQSMALGKAGTRFDQVVGVIRDRGLSNDPKAGAQVSVFRFGDRLAAVDPASLNPHPTTDDSTPRSAPGEALAAAPGASQEPPEPTDSDTRLAASLEGLAGRFDSTPPQAVVVFSDGRARDPERADAIARAYRKLNVPVHVFPVGEEDVGGDVAIVSMVAPTQARKFSEIASQVFVRSFGYAGRGAELKIVALDPSGQPSAVLARTPISLQDGLATYTLSFSSGDEDRKIAAVIDPQPGEVSAENNQFTTELSIDHTKIRVLYLEGATESFVANRATGGRGANSSTAGEVKGAYSPLLEALTEDPDIECAAVTLLTGASGNVSFFTRADARLRGLPSTASEFFAFDALILSNVPREALGDEQLAWLEDWIGHRGGGLCMAGGPNSFASGRWNESSVAKMLPVELSAVGRDWLDDPVTLRPSNAGRLHPIWHISTDEVKNRDLLKTLPAFQGHNRLGRLKPGAEAVATDGDASPSPLIAAQPFGRGRTMAMLTGVTRRYANDFSLRWGEGDARYYNKFWRNVVYWLTENSSIARRRLLAETDKRLYRPGEPIMVRAHAFDENAAATLGYRVAVSIEPRSASDAASDLSPLRRPSGLPSESAEATAAGGPLLPWGDEFELTRSAADTAYNAKLDIATAKSLPPGVTLTQGLRIELTAYEDNTQVDSTAIEVQVLDDPTEQQNPLPDHALLRRIAEQSGGTVLKTADDLSSMLAGLPRIVGPSEIKTVPAWSTWPLLLALLALLTIEWVWRRRLGLA
ncbi:glutamine amidotransferase [Paludisphaera borealis]|uniref:VWFA domain-containing protein n=1 Tax=Paludisphaera borealis TaxID=1387353 RepID=A0A1U7CJT2_9BACT|nr:glutamine amidotransferase [Paludisphaera borealis]APW59166.1 hypothetical protein BSF38_00580 [Paludisphaera borealis]